MEIVQIDIDRLGTRRDARKHNEAVVRGLVDSIADIGIVNPLRVRRRCQNVDGIEGDGFEIIAGAHRFRAALKLGLAEVPCVVVGDDDLHAELAMIDENLCRAELSPADRAAQTARRKTIREIMGLNSTAGQASAAGMNAAIGNDVGENFAPTFTAETAEKIGRSQRLVQLDVERGEKVCAEAIDLVRGTDLDKGTYLDKLKKLDAPEQIATVNRALSGLARAAEREKQDAAEKRAQTRVEADARDRAANALAERIIANFPADEIDAAKADAFACGAKALAIALNNLSGQSIMDKAA